MIDRTEEEIMKDWNGSGDNPAVSIICICYNHGKYIAQCLDGFLEQKTTFPFAIYIHDDCSTDDSASIIEKYKEKFPRIINVTIEEHNLYSKSFAEFDKAVYSNFQTKGKYLAFCEGDDYWCYPYKLQKQYEFLETHSEYVAVGHMTNIVDANGQKCSAWFLNSKPGECTCEDIGKWTLFSHFSSWMFRKSEYYNYLKNNYDDYIKVTCTGDRKVPVVLLSLGKLWVMDGWWSVYRFQSGPDSYTARKEKFDLYKLYVANYQLSEYAQKLGLDISFDEKLNDRLYDMFIIKIKHPSSKFFFKTLKFRNRYVSDLWYCISRLVGKRIHFNSH